MFSARSHALVRKALAGRKTMRNAEGSIMVAEFATINSVNINHYEVLGIPKSSTQTDIKAAYYKLSMQYHPDKNQGCTISANKFREITQAYEVLGNYRLRRLYDKGAIHAAGAKVGGVTEEYPYEEPDDPETKFYKSRFTRSTVTDSTGRKPIYNFDEWSRAHYGDSFERRKQAKQNWERRQTQNELHTLTSQSEMLLFGIIACAMGLYLLFGSATNYDTPKKVEEEVAGESSPKT